MPKVTSKLQITVPKSVAERLGISPGDDIEWHLEGSAARVTRSQSRRGPSLAERLAVFDESTVRQDARNRAWAAAHKGRRPAGRGWTREDLYTRGRAR